MPTTIQALVADSGEGAVARYIAGLGQLEAGGEEIGYMIFVVVEDDATPPTRLAGPFGLTDMMTRAQAVHLHTQLGNALGLVTS